MTRHVQSFRPVSPEGATEHRQAVERSETPAKMIHKYISAEGTTEFCHPVGVLKLSCLFYRGFVLRTPPPACIMASPSGFAFRYHP